MVSFISLLIVIPISPFSFFKAPSLYLLHPYLFEKTPQKLLKKMHTPALFFEKALQIHPSEIAHAHQPRPFPGNAALHQPIQPIYVFTAELLPLYVKISYASRCLRPFQTSVKAINPSLTKHHPKLQNRYLLLRSRKTELPHRHPGLTRIRPRLQRLHSRRERLKTTLTARQPRRRRFYPMLPRLNPRLQGLHPRLRRVHSSLTVLNPTLTAQENHA